MFIHDKEQCIHCGTCVKECPNGCLKLEDDAVLHTPDLCMWCGHCLAVCPRDAIMIDGDGYNVEEVEDFQFFKKSTPDMVRRDIMMRRSVRHFNDIPVKDEDIERIIEAAKYAPTAKNCQHNALMILNDSESIKEMLADEMEQMEIIGQSLMREKPEVAAFFLKKVAEYKEEGKDGLFYNSPLVIFVFSDTDIDGAICAATMGQVIDSLGLGFCYLRLAADPMNTETLRKKYDIPEEKHCVIALTIGNTDTEYFCSVPRKDIPLL
ncbi:MAG: nitroreductase family protein [Parasporobacterium sp.]|nr:nitroreductase family protein [Parasporobacterium sp.]